ncbi:MAG: hypothetical protein ABSA46_18635 [Thermodesulfovibrionales bacterium]|jgi:hypothetical protein
MVRLNSDKLMLTDIVLGAVFGIANISDNSSLWQQGDLDENDGHRGLPQTSEFPPAESVELNSMF